MEKYRHHLLKWARASVTRVEEDVDRAQAMLADAEEELDTAKNNLALLEDKVNNFFANVRPVSTMPAKGEVFITQRLNNEDPRDVSYPNRPIGTVCVLLDPTFGFGVRFTADEDSMILRDGEPEFRAGDMLEYLGVGPCPFSIGEHVVFTREEHMENYYNVVLRHAIESYEDPYDSQGFREEDDFFSENIIDIGKGRVSNIGGRRRVTHADTWPPIPGRILALEPRCSAYTHLPNGVRTLDEISKLHPAEYTRAFFTLREVLVPVVVEMKAARHGTKRK